MSSCGIKNSSKSLGKKVYVTRRIPEPGLLMLSNEGCDITLNQNPTPPSKDEILANVAGKDAILCTVSDQIDKKVMEAAGSGLKVISSYSSGYDHIDIEEATARGIYVTSASVIPAEATADLTFALILACARRMIEGDCLVRENKWESGWSPNLLVGYGVYRTTLGIIGLGTIGSAVARRARGFSMRILYYDQVRNYALESKLGVEYASLDQLLEESDFVSVHVPLNMSTYHMIDSSKLQKIKKTAFLINTARGGVINEADLIGALRDKRIAGAGLDVFENEPILSTNPLLKMKEHVVLEPHLGCATFQTRSEMSESAAGCILDILDNREPLPALLVNPGVKNVRPLKLVQV